MLPPSWNGAYKGTPLSLSGGEWYDGKNGFSPTEFVFDIT